MCGRFVSVSTPEQLAETFGVDQIRTDSMGERYNVAPTRDVYSVVEAEGQRRLGTLRWGFLPFWAKSHRDRAPINARIEGIEDKRMFASAFAKRRCLVPADGFYEWQERDDSSRKQPWYIHDPDGAPLGLAGIWSVWRDPEQEEADPLFTCAIVTTRAAGRMADLHHRMPVVLPERLWDDWLAADPREASHLHEVVERAEVPRLQARTISTKVNHVRNDSPDLLDPDTVD